MQRVTRVTYKRAQILRYLDNSVKLVKPIKCATFSKWTTVGINRYLHQLKFLLKDGTLVLVRIFALRSRVYPHERISDGRAFKVVTTIVVRTRSFIAMLVLILCSVLSCVIVSVQYKLGCIHVTTCCGTVLTDSPRPDLASSNRWDVVTQLTHLPGSEQHAQAWSVLSEIACDTLSLKVPTGPGTTLLLNRSTFESTQLRYNASSTFTNTSLLKGRKSPSIIHH